MIPDAAAREIDRRVSVDELHRELNRPIGDTERDEVLSLVRWFTRRYHSPEARLAYVRRAYLRWRRMPWYSVAVDGPIRSVVADDPRVAYALLFGSSATGYSTSFSDLDVAIGLKPGAEVDHRAIGRLTARLEHAAGRVVDLVVLDEASPALAYRIFRDGRLFFEADRAARVRRQVRAILEYLDFKPFEQQCARAVLDAAARG